LGSDVSDTTRVRAETPADHDAIRHVVVAAFGGTAEADLVDALRRGRHAIVPLALVAEREGTVVGHVMVSTAHLHTPTGIRAVALLAPLAVDPDHQGEGVGTALVRSVADLADARGEPFLLLEGDPAYYGRLGFEPASGHGIRLPLPDWAPSAAAQVLRLSGDDPTLRGTVTYAPPFADLA
jgi:putative acetyltransferase